ncbi:hypothetical protein M427DRAFT_45071 [Gonapodya prolifera JEL478]|uniref:Uncharacterized protein n=1 Tax=Gonapodya prolifera (strain JEL478) TaxID=1344416 RepID=A0A139ACE2_GONPJ|nr:hypothetical protein M427DRAFT_45071 [Gonapodya prolifera JEL478]|eukprot:KXS14471.1 hypothetical protein M427DRAFT_45071 [Gonapodya prolifera JEL478]
MTRFTILIAAVVALSLSLIVAPSQVSCLRSRRRLSIEPEVLCMRARELFVSLVVPISDVRRQTDESSLGCSAPMPVVLPMSERAWNPPHRRGADVLGFHGISPRTRTNSTSVNTVTSITASSSQPTCANATDCTATATVNATATATVNGTATATVDATATATVNATATATVDATATATVNGTATVTVDGTATTTVNGTATSANVAPSESATTSSLSEATTTSANAALSETLSESSTTSSLSDATTSTPSTSTSAVTSTTASGSSRASGASVTGSPTPSVARATSATGTSQVSAAAVATQTATSARTARMVRDVAHTAIAAVGGVVERSDGKILDIGAAKIPRLSRRKQEDKLDRASVREVTSASTPPRDTLRNETPNISNQAHNDLQDKVATSQPICLSQRDPGEESLPPLPGKAAASASTDDKELQDSVNQNKLAQHELLLVSDLPPESNSAMPGPHSISQIFNNPPQSNPPVSSPTSASSTSLPQLNSIESHLKNESKVSERRGKDYHTRTGLWRIGGTIRRKSGSGRQRSIAKRRTSIKSSPEETLHPVDASLNEANHNQVDWGRSFSSLSIVLLIISLLVLAMLTAAWYLDSAVSNAGFLDDGAGEFIRDIAIPY